MSLKNIYYDTSHEAGYAGARNLIRVNVARNKREKTKIYEWLSNQDVYTLHKPVRRKFPRLRYNVTNIDDCWEIDLCDMQSFKEYNDGYCYLLVVIDVLSKYAWVEILRDKSASSVADAFKILKRSNTRVPISVQSDKGKEFTGANFQDYLKKRDIKFRTVRNPDVKAAVVERLNRTLKERMFRYFTHKNTHRYIDVIQNIVKAYNHTLHSGIRMIPAEVTIYNASKARMNLEKRALSQRKPSHAPIYSMGSYVRISRTKGTFEKGYEKNYSEEIFKISRISRRQQLYTYELSDLNGEKIDGFFYPEELVKVGKKRLDETEKFKIERVIRSQGRGRNKQVLVKWYGYPEKFNSWINASELTNL